MRGKGILQVVGTLSLPLRSDRVLLERLLSSLSLGLSRAAPAQLNLAGDVFHELFVFLSVLLDQHMSEQAGFGPLSEERTLRALNCLRSLLTASTDGLAFLIMANAMSPSSLCLPPAVWPSSTRVCLQWATVCQCYWQLCRHGKLERSEPLLWRLF